MIKKLSDREKLILFAVANMDTKIDWKTVYLSCRDDNGANVNEKNLPVLVSQWKQSERIKTYLDEQKTLIEKRREKEKEQVINDYKIKLAGNGAGGDAEKTGKNGAFNGEIDFTNKDQFLNYLNTQVNIISDPKQKTDYLKMLSDLLRFKEDSPNKDGENQIQRFYTPILCKDCKLYQAKKDEIESK